MSQQLKLSLLALVSTAAAIPHYGHSKFHNPSGAYGTGKPYPSGGWGGHNSTGVPQPTGTGVYPGDDTTTLVQTDYSTETVVSTIYATRPTGGSNGEAPSVGAADVSTGVGAGSCGPDTVYVTATEKVTVTVPAGGAAVPSSSAAEATSEAPASSAQGEGYGVSSVTFVLPSSSAFVEKPVEKPSSKAAEYTSAPVEEAYSSKAPASTPAPSSAPVESSAAPSSAAVSSAVESSTPVSSSTPAPTSPSGGGYSGSKRGLAYNEAGLCKSFSGSKFGFAYNWGSTEGQDIGTMYIPTCHSPAKITSEQWLEDVKTAVDGGSSAVMGFNEPDHAAQANLTPEQACTSWKEYMNPIASSHPDVTIIGPSVTNGGAPMGLTWLSSFAETCSDAVWHAANIHFYDQYDDQVVQRFKSHIEEAIKDYNKPVWVTEFGLNPGTASEEQAATFLKDVMEYMDGNESVKGYSYFMVGTGENQLNSANGLSATGEIYASS